MMGYVLVRHSDGAFVAPSGSAASYTLSLQLARIYPDRASAEWDSCGNESAVSVDSILRRG